MKPKFVWVVTICYDSNLGIYSTEEKANNALKKAQEEKCYTSDGDYVERVEIDSDRWSK